MDPLRFIRTKDAEFRALMQAIAEATHRLEEQRDENRARMIANAVSKSIFGKG